MENRIPVIIVNGPLGSGKTTVVHDLLVSHPNPQRVLWLKTEYGEESIDEYLLHDTQVATTSLVGGCVCHVLLGQMDRVLGEIDTSAYDLLIIETSGMSHPLPVYMMIERHAHLVLWYRILIVDSAHCHESTYPKPRHDALMARVYDVILVTKYPWTLSDVEERDMQQRLDPWYADAMAEIPKILVHMHEAVPPEAVNSAFAGGDPLHLGSRVHLDLHDFEDHEAEVQTLTFHFSLTQVIDTAKIDAYILSLQGAPVRVKGIICVAPGAYKILNWARGEGNWRETQAKPEKCMLVVMGYDIATSQNKKIDV
jgi:G3E family GTPase